MDTNKTSKAPVIALVVLVVALIGFIFLGKSTPAPVPQTSQPGAVAGPDIQSPYISYGGVRTWAFSTQAISTQGASTTCQILSPAATTTLVSASSYFTSIASTSPVEIGFAYTATSTAGQNGVQYTGETGIRSFATTTLISPSAISLPASGGLVIASSTASTLQIPPYTYINTKIGGGGQATPGLVNGVCKATLREVTNI